MKNIMLLISCFLILSTCGKKEIKQEKINNSPKDLTSQIIFEDCKTYGEFREKLQDLYCEEDEVINRLDSLLAKNHIRIIYEECEDFIIDIGHRENTMKIWENIDKKFRKIFDISAELKKHYTNNGKDPMYADSPDKLLVEIALPVNQDIKTLEQVLEELILTFKELNYKSEVKELSNMIFSFIGKNTNQEYYSEAPFLNLKFIKYLSLSPPPVPQD